MRCGRLRGLLPKETGYTLLVDHSTIRPDLQLHGHLLLAVSRSAWLSLSQVSFVVHRLVRGTKSGARPMVRGSIFASDRSGSRSWCCLSLGDVRAGHL